jgi:putative hemolysin
VEVKSSLTTPLQRTPIRHRDDFTAMWGKTDVLTLDAADSKPYWLGFASSDRCVEEALRLRYEVFNLELGEGLASSATTGLDRDAYDKQMTHLVLVDKESGGIIGTYRVQTVRNGLAAKGVYTAGEYCLEAMAHLFDEAIEVGRACLAEDHRTMQAIVLLWRGIAEYMELLGQHYIFGCCSLTSQDPDDGWRAMKTIRRKGYLHPDLFMPAQSANSCGDPSREFAPDLGEAIRLPKLFRTYMHLGTRVVSEPAIDREFGTVDFVVLMDAREVNLSSLEIVT